MERFVGGLIEHYAGAFPVWLAPEQVRVIPISDDALEACRTLHDQLKAAGLRVTLDDRPQTLNYRIREAEVQKIPYMAIIGKREAEAGQVALRTRGKGSKQDIIPATDFIARVKQEKETRALTP
jgi:threonyl-tRNA synthetase